MSWKVHCLPVRSSSTVRLPFLRPTSPSSCPSRPLAPSVSIQASSAARSGITPRDVGDTGGTGTGAARVALTAGKARRAGTGACAAADAVTNGRLLAPANTVTRLSGSIRTCISAPTRLSRSARTRPVIRPELDTPTSALGALATIVPSGSRTTISRMRSAVRPLASRSSWVPPTST